RAGGRFHRRAPPRASGAIPPPRRQPPAGAARTLLRHGTPANILTMQTQRNLLGAPQAAHTRVEIYSGVARLARTVWASEVRPAGDRPKTAVMICHPTANFLGHYALPGLAARGLAGVGLTTRYVGN